MANAINYRKQSADAYTAWLAYHQDKQRFPIQGQVDRIAYVDFLAGWNAAQFAAKVDKAIESLNQCDGCRRGLAINLEGIHEDEKGNLFMACEKNRYS